MLNINYAPIPLNRQILVKANTPGETRSEAGLYLQPKEAVSNLVEGTIIAVDATDTHQRERRHALEVGQTILFYKQSGAPVYIDGVEHLFIEERHLFGLKP